MSRTTVVRAGLAATVLAATLGVAVAQNEPEENFDQPRRQELAYPDVVVPPIQEDRTLQVEEQDDKEESDK